VSRPLGFPRGSRVLVRLVLGAVLVPLLLVDGVGGWLAWRLTPLQNFYLNAYAASSMGQAQPHAATNIRWVMKTAPGRKPEPMDPGDAAPGGTRKLPVALSAQARAEGWQGVTLSARERIASATLAPFLAHAIYDDTSLTMLCGFPALVEITGLIGLLLALEQVRQSWGNPDRLGSAAQGSLSYRAGGGRAGAQPGSRVSRHFAQPAFHLPGRAAAAAVHERPADVVARIPR
jgi:hypothetical protein